MSDKHRKLGGSFKPVLDILTYEDPCVTTGSVVCLFADRFFARSIAKAVRYACGQTLVCNTIDEARELAYGESKSASASVCVSRRRVTRGRFAGKASAAAVALRRWISIRFACIAVFIVYHSLLTCGLAGRRTSGRRTRS